MEFKNVNQFDNLEMSYLCDFSGGYISRNKNLFSRIDLTDLNKFILENKLK